MARQRARIDSGRGDRPEAEGFPFARPRAVRKNPRAYPGKPTSVRDGPTSHTVATGRTQRAEPEGLLPVQAGRLPMRCRIGPVTKR